MKIHSLKIKKKFASSSDSASFILEVPKELESVFKYTCGQYVTAIFNVEGRKIGRGYSIASCPYTDSDLQLTVKKVDKGTTSVYVVDKLKEGDFLDVTPPQGKFFDVSQNTQAFHYILIGAGSGITPLFSILKTVLIENKDNKVTLLYGNRKEDNIIFKKELEQLTDQYEGRLRVTHYLSQPEPHWKGKSGRVRLEDIKACIEDLKLKPLPLSFYICGPEALMKASQKVILSCGVEPERVHIEWYHAPHKTEDDEDDESVIIGPGKKASPQTLTVFLAGEELKLKANKEISILETLLNEGHSPPFSCMAGACQSCLGVVEEGLVKQPDVGILTDEEISNHKTLTCQAFASSQDVTIRYVEED